MSETNTNTPPGETRDPPPAPEYVPTHVLSSDPDPEPDKPEPDKPADEPEKPAEPAKPEKTPEEKRAEAEDRRYRTLYAQRYAEKARADAAEAARADLQERIRQLENPNQPQPPDIDKLVAERAEALVQQREGQARITDFHTAGQAAYPDWESRCKDLMEMGADAGLSHLLVELPDGARVAGSLAENPQELQRIAEIKTERGRAIALGRYSAELAARPPPPPVAQSRAPAPIQPPSGGRARGEPDPNGSYADYQKWSERQQWARQ